MLTPHPGEMARLVGMTVKEVEADRVGAGAAVCDRKRRDAGAERMADAGGASRWPRGRWNTTGNPSMAKGGSGDILTGIVAAMLAQYPDHVAEAVEAAGVSAWAGGRLRVPGAGGTYGAGDGHRGGVCGGAFRARAVDEDGLTWIAGTAAAQEGLGRTGMKEFTREKRLRTRSVAGTLGLGEMITELLRAPKLVVLRAGPGRRQDDAGAGDRGGDWGIGR